MISDFITQPLVTVPLLTLLFGACMMMVDRNKRRKLAAAVASRSKAAPGA